MIQLIRSTQLSLAGLPIPVAIVYLVSTVFNLLAYNQGDLSHTVGSSYAYLFGHGLDFYDYNTTEFVGNDYFPTTYIVFAIWMAPVKLLLSPGVQNGTDISAPEIAWAKLLLLILFWLTFLVVARIAREIFPNRPVTQSTVRIAFLLSPLAAFSFNVIGQYDIIGVLLTSLGFLCYLRGDKWRFAVFFALAASNKYFALVIFVPLVLLQFKRIRDIALLGLVGISLLVIEGAAYLSNSAFREHTMFGLIGGKVDPSSGRELVQILLGVVFLLGCVAIWRFLLPTRATLAPLSIFTVIVAFGLMISVVVWHPQWFIIVTPFFALATGFLRRPARFLIWDSAFFVVFVWIVVNQFAWNVDARMVDTGVLRDVLVHPTGTLGSFYPNAAVPVLSVLLTVYLFSPMLFVYLERRRPQTPTADHPHISSGVWWLRVLAVPVSCSAPIIALMLASA